MSRTLNTVIKSVTFKCTTCIKSVVLVIPDIAANAALPWALRQAESRGWDVSNLNQEKCPDHN